MSPKLAYNFGDTSQTQIELEDLRNGKDFRGLFDRCFRGDINCHMFIEVMKSLSHDWFSPTSHTSLWQNLTAHLKLYKRPGGDLLFNSSLLPGSGIAKSSTVSLDGETVAYLTETAIGLEELGTRRALTVKEFQAAVERGPDQVAPMRINIIRTSPYQVRSIAIDLSDGFAWRGIPRLLGIDDNYVYVMADAANDRHTFIRVPVDGSPRGEEPREFRFPGRCCFFDLRQLRIWYIDSEAMALVETALDGGNVHRTPLQLPEGLEVSQLHELAIADEGKIMLLSVDHRQAPSRFVFALGTKKEGSSETEKEPWSMRWFRVKDLDGPACITNCLSGPAFDVSGHAVGDNAFYCLDRTGLLFALNLEQVRNESGLLDQLDASTLLKPCGQADTKGDTWLSGVALARSLPLAASYSTTANSIQVWDLARKCRLYEIECPYHIDAAFFLHEDRLLVTVARSMGIKHGTVAVSFLDCALLMGKPPVYFTAND